MLKIFAIGRSLSGIYRELRQLRRLAECYLTAAEIPLPPTPYERLKEKLSTLAPEPTPATLPTEDEQAQSETDRIMRDLAAGRDPGTDWRPW